MNQAKNRAQPRDGANAIRSRAGVLSSLHEEIYRPREPHTQKKFVQRAINLTLAPGNDSKNPADRPAPIAGARASRRSPSTLRLNRSNVKRKPAARGRTRHP